MSGCILTQTIPNQPVFNFPCGLPSITTSLTTFMGLSTVQLISDSLGPLVQIPYNNTGFSEPIIHLNPSNVTAIFVNFTQIKIRISTYLYTVILAANNPTPTSVKIIYTCSRISNTSIRSTC